MGITDTIHELPNITIKPESENLGKKRDKAAEFERRQKLVGSDRIASVYETESPNDQTHTVSTKWYKKPIVLIGGTLLLIGSLIALLTNSKK